MSQWTHVNASVRLDAIRMLPGALGANAISNLGLMFHDYLDEDIASGEVNVWNPYVKYLKKNTTSQHEKCDVPCGSEGSLFYHVVENPSQSSISAYTLTIWGDLRDYDDAEEICQYIYNITKDKMVRSGILEIHVEYREVSVYRYVDDEKNWVLVDTPQTTIE